ncbi:dihydrofolate reductase family protein [Haloactinopolyspora sp.]|uniref:dihydrofolate reductase family protein n=1 Tax=Haloactinopolyspora sp. TaxID=1966353 RepID=UPI0026156544|nr:dihydrofolate reductase family protein [Haloactinopolyspora sp.]
MRKLTYFIASTLDGFIAGPDASDPTGVGGFWPIADDYVSHLIETFPETLPGLARDALGVTAEGTRFDTALEGRRSYQVGLDAGVTNAYPHLRHIVISGSMTESPDPGVELADDPVATVQELKQRPGRGIWLVGGGELAGTLSAEIDELILKISPLTINTGVPLFGRNAAFDPRVWTLIEHTVLDSGTLFLTYTRRGE